MSEKNEIVMVTEKDNAHLERVESDSEDSLHRHNLGQDSHELAGYWKGYRFLGSLLAITLMANSLFIGYAMPVNILSIIDADIGPSPNIYLVTTCFTLVSGILLLVVGRLSDIIGRRYFAIGGQVLAIIGSIICARATNINMVIGGTVLTGAAGAGQQLYPLLVQELVPNKHRFVAQGAISFAVLPTLGFAPLLARAMVANPNLGWRWCYWINVIVCVVTVVLYAACYFPPNFHMINSEMTKMQELRQLDYGGFFLYSAGLVLIILGFSKDYTLSNQTLANKISLG
jgi:MFS family permease